MEDFAELLDPEDLVGDLVELLDEDLGVEDFVDGDLVAEEFGVELFDVELFDDELLDEELLDVELLDVDEVDGAAVGSSVDRSVGSSSSSGTASTVVVRTLYGCSSKYMELNARDVMTAFAKVGCMGYASSGRPLKLDRRRNGRPHVDVNSDCSSPGMYYGTWALRAAMRTARLTRLNTELM